jgi:hypothetical protein
MITYSDLKRKLEINPDKHLNDGFASLTHYWQNNGNGASDYFRNGYFFTKSSTLTIVSVSAEI